jgi:hypothetical protein
VVGGELLAESLTLFLGGEFFIYFLSIGIYWHSHTIFWYENACHLSHYSTAHILCCAELCSSCTRLCTSYARLCISHASLIMLTFGAWILAIKVFAFSY